jgi:hypothetical protein
VSYALGLVDCAVAVVVHSVIGDLGRSGIDLRVAVVAVALGCGRSSSPSAAQRYVRQGIAAHVTNGCLEHPTICLSVVPGRLSPLGTGNETSEEVEGIL